MVWVGVGGFYLHQIGLETATLPANPALLQYTEVSEMTRCEYLNKFTKNKISEKPREVEDKLEVRLRVKERSGVGRRWLRELFTNRSWVLALVHLRHAPPYKPPRLLRPPGPACSLSQEGEQNTVEQGLVNTQQSWHNLPEESEDKGLVMRQPS
ncbi:unnamed protein product [Boreogadus saida]